MEQAVAARESALALWRTLGQALKAGDTLRWLSRLHWFLGHKGQADAHAAAAIAALEALPPSPELAMAYSNQAQLHALADEMAPAVQWGERAIALAERLGNTEILAHALTNVGTARYRNGLQEGALQIERSLALALEGGLEEHAARAYCNLGIGGVMGRDYARAAPVIDTGIAYCNDHDLDAWSYYLLAWRAQLHLEQGRWEAAVADADAVLARPGVAAIARIPALAALGRLRARRGDPGAAEVLDEAMALARPTGELQRVWPVAMARAEAAWIRGDNEACAEEALFCLDLARRLGNPRAIGECALWLQRAGAPQGEPPGALPADAPEPCALQLAGQWREAAAAWAALGRPFDRALALADGDEAARREALSLIEGLGAHAVAQRLRAVLRQAGVRDLPPPQRGPRASTREHPFGLTARELQTLQLLCEGLRNAEIAARLHRSVRTVDHHLAAVFAKLGVDSRGAAIALAQREGLAAQSGQTRRAM
jgi:DNA-binding CsgD family transcriptional regulator